MRHHGISVIYYLVLSNTAKQICCFQEEIHQKKWGNVKKWDLRKGGRKIEEAGAHGVNFPGIKEKAHCLSSCPCSFLIAVFCSQPVPTGSRWCADFSGKFLVFLCMYSSLYSKSLATWGETLLKYKRMGHDPILRIRTCIRIRWTIKIRRWEISAGRDTINGIFRVQKSMLMVSSVSSGFFPGLLTARAGLFHSISFVLSFSLLHSPSSLGPRDL